MQASKNKNADLFQLLGLWPKTSDDKGNIFFNIISDGLIDTPLNPISYLPTTNPLRAMSNRGTKTLLMPNR